MSVVYLLQVENFNMYENMNIRRNNSHIGADLGFSLSSCSSRLNIELAYAALSAPEMHQHSNINVSSTY